jgi:hypothetical protein
MEGRSREERNGDGAMGRTGEQPALYRQFALAKRRDKAAWAVVVRLFGFHPSITPLPRCAPSPRRPVAVSPFRRFAPPLLSLFRQPPA